MKIKLDKRMAVLYSVFMSRQEPFALVDTEVLICALLKYENGTDLMTALDETVGDSTDSVEIISGHRRDTLRA